MVKRWTRFAHVVGATGDEKRTIPSMDAVNLPSPFEQQIPSFALSNIVNLYLPGRRHWTPVIHESRVENDMLDTTITSSLSAVKLLPTYRVLPEKLELLGGPATTSVQTSPFRTCNLHEVSYLHRFKRRRFEGLANTQEKS